MYLSRINHKTIGSIGKWTQEDTETIEGLPRQSIEFFEDGKAVIADVYSGTYKLLDNGELQVSVEGEVYQDPITIKGNTLTITKDDGVSKSYIKE